MTHSGKTMWRHSCMQIKGRGLGRNYPCQHLDLGLPALGLWDNNLLWLKLLACGVWLWQPEKTCNFDSWGDASAVSWLSILLWPFYKPLVLEKVLIAQSCRTLCDHKDCSLPGSSVHGILQARILTVGCYSFLQRIFLTQGLNLGLLHCRQILYHLSHQGSPSKPNQLLNKLLNILISPWF